MDAAAALAAALQALEVPVTRAGPREWRVTLPVGAHRSFGVVATAAERTVTLSAFFMRAPDRNHAEVYRGLLRRNLDLPEWRFAVDDDGDMYLVARVDAGVLTPERLDALLGLLVSLGETTHEAVMRQGFVVPESSGPPPS